MTDAPTVETVTPPAPPVEAVPAAPPPKLSMEDTMAAKFDEIQSRTDEAAKDAPARVRGPDGKFASTKKAEAPAPAAEPPKTQAVEPPIEAPEHWTAEDKAEFEKVKDAEARKVLLAQSKRLEAAHTRKSQETAERVKQAEPFLAVAKQYESLSNGMPAHQHYASLAQTQATLARAAAQGDVQPFLDLAAQFGLNLGAPSPAAGGQPDHALRRELGNLRAELEGFKQREANREGQARAQTQESAVSEIKAFEDAKDAQGTPAHPHFSQVRERMAALMGADPTLTLDTAYDSACWAIPAVRQKLLDAERAKETEKARQLAAQALKSNGANVRPGGGGPSRVTKGATIEDTMSRVYDGLSQ